APVLGRSPKFIEPIDGSAERFRTSGGIAEFHWLNFLGKAGSITSGSEDQPTYSFESQPVRTRRASRKGGIEIEAKLRIEHEVAISDLRNVDDVITFGVDLAGVV